MIRKIIFVVVLTVALITAYNIGDVTAGGAKCSGIKAQKAGTCAKTAAADKKTSCEAMCKAADRAGNKTAAVAACKGVNCAGCNMCKGAKAHAKNCAGTCCSKTAYLSHARAVAKVSDVIPYGETKRVVLTGNVICGGCKLEGLDRCQPMLKTSDGKLYPLAQNAMVKKMGACKGGDVSYRISGRVKKVYGVKYLDVTSYSTL